MPAKKTELKTFSQGSSMKKQIATITILALVAPGLARAESMNPSGLYSEAKMKTAQSAAPAKQGVSGEVKQWAESKWNEIRSMWGSNPAPAKAPTRKVASVPSTTSPSKAMPQVVPPPSAKLELAAPVASNETSRGPVDIPGLTRTASGVASYDTSASDSIPRLSIEKEKSIKANDYALDSSMQKVMEDRVIHALDSSEVMTQAAFRALIALKEKAPGKVATVKDVKFPLKGKVSRVAFDKIAINLRPEIELKLKAFKPLTKQEMRFLSGLLLYQQDQNCPVAIGLFHNLSKSNGWEAEANYYMAMCSKKMGLQSDFFERSRRVLDTQDNHYAKLMMDELGSDIPHEFVDGIGNALLKLSSNDKVWSRLSPETAANMAYNLADFTVTSSRYKTALTWAAKVPQAHPKYLKAQFLLSLAEYQAGSKEKATKIQAGIIDEPKTDKEKMEFQALVALNAARMQFQEQDFKSAHTNFMKVYKDHPLWLQSLTELGWAQLMDGDFEGAIGNMYSIQSPFFASAYKPESFVIRTIGYLNLCQYGDAYRTLSILEHEYRPYLTKMDAFINKGPKASYYNAVKGFINAGKGVKEVEGLPMPVIREMARFRDYTNLQKSLNRQIDERPNYAKVQGPVEKGLKRAQDLVTASRKRADELRLRVTGKRPAREEEQYKGQWVAELEKELDLLNDRFFMVDVYNEAKTALEEYKKEVVGGADVRIAKTKANTETVLANRMLKLKMDLARMLDNNELLRYEVFAGSGENIRYQVAGGETGNRVPASILPKSKSLQWDFDGEYWEDEIGHYRSSLKNMCPGNKEATKHASLEKTDGGEQ